MTHDVSSLTSYVHVQGMEHNTIRTRKMTSSFAAAVQAVHAALLLASISIALPEVAAFSPTASIGENNRELQLSTSSLQSSPAPLFVDTEQSQQRKDRPLLRRFGRGINERAQNSKEGHNRFGLADHFTSGECIPCLDISCAGNECGSSEYENSSRGDIRRAYTADSGVGRGAVHGRSSGSGCAIIRLRGEDAASIRGLTDFADRFFDGVDDSECKSSQSIKDVGVFRIANNVHAGFDKNVNREGKMQVLYTKLIPGDPEEEGDPLMLPLEVGDMVGSTSLRQAHSGMRTLFDVGSQITSAVLGMDSVSASKLLDDCTLEDNCERQPHDSMTPDKADEIADTVSNSYQRLIRYLKPQQQAGGATADNDAAFWPHVDSTFLTLIPMSDIPGLEVWCPSSENAEPERGEWVRPIRPADDESKSGRIDDNEEDCAYVFALAGEFLQLLSDGKVPTCIHRVIPPRPPGPAASGFASKPYKQRVSAPLFMRPRRGEAATLDVSSDLIDQKTKGLYFEEGLLEECDEMRVWDYMDCMSPNN